MNILRIIWSIIVFEYLSLNLVGQQVYFSNRYNLCQRFDEEAWSAATGIIQLDDGFSISGASVDTITYWRRRIPILKITFDGQPVFIKSYGDSISDYYAGWSGNIIKSTSCEKYFIAGVKEYWQPENYAVGYLMAFNGEFDTIWTKTYNINEDPIFDTNANFTQVNLCSNSDLIFAGSMNGTHLLLLRTDSTGNELWHKTFHYGGNTLCTGYTAIQTSDGGFALGGFRYTIGQEETGNPVIVKTDSIGNQKWVKYMGGPLLDHAAFLVNSTDGNIIMGSVFGDEMVGNEARSRINIAKLDNDGNVLWDKKYGRTIYHNVLLNIKVLSDGSIIACGSNAGYYSSDMGWIIKVNKNGDSLWYREYSFLNGTDSKNLLWAVIETSDRGIAACGEIFPAPPDTGNRDAWVIKLDSIGCEFAGCDSTVGIEEQGGMGAWRQGGLEIWPNPARDWITLTLPDLVSSDKVKLLVYDVFGREMEMGRQGEKGKRGPGDQETGRPGDELVNRMISLDVSCFSSGMYVAVVVDLKGRRYTGKFVVVR